MVKCNICDGMISVAEADSLIIENVPDHTFSFSDITIKLHVINCDTCGAVQLYNVPLSEDYDSVYRSIGVSLNYREEKKQQLKEFINAFNLNGKDLIEIGCGDGQFLEIFRELSIECYGVEVGEKNYQKCLEKKFNVVQGNVSVLNKQYDAFFSFHYLEHLPEPRVFVQSLAKVLKPGGIGLLEVPNYDHIEKNNIWLEFTKDHRYYYRKRTLSYLLLSFGFEIEYIEENSGGLCLTVAIRRPNDNDGFSSMKNQINKDAGDFKDLIDSLNSKFVVYGAGHYSQLLLNLANKLYGIKPEKIFDSNKQKCGNKICNVEIEHKDTMSHLQDYHIVIICGVYNNEIYNMIVQNKNLEYKGVVKWK